MENIPESGGVKTSKPEKHKSTLAAAFGGEGEDHWPDVEHPDPDKYVSRPITEIIPGLNKIMRWVKQTLKSNKPDQPRIPDSSPSKI